MILLKLYGIFHPCVNCSAQCDGFYGLQFYFSLLLSLSFMFPFSLTQKMVYVAEDGLEDYNNKRILDIKMKFLFV